MGRLVGRRLHPVAWVGLVIAVVAAIAWMFFAPGDVAYLLGPLAVIVPVAVAVAARGPALLDWYERSTRRALVALWLATLVLAMAGAVWAILDPDGGGYLVGGLMSLPVLFATGLLDRGGATSDDSGDSGLAGDVFGPPPL